MGRRGTKRVDVRLPVRVWGTDGDGQPFSQIVYTLDVSLHGARLCGFHGRLKAGDTVGLQYRNNQLRHRVAWVESVRDEVWFGVESMQPEKPMWGSNLPGAYADDYVVPASPSGRSYEKPHHERRRHTRYPVSGTAVVSNSAGSDQRSLRLADISLEGCFLETDAPFAASTRLKLHLQLHATEIEALGIVRASFPGTGMGVQFTHVSPEDSKRLRVITKRLAAAEKLTTATTVAAYSWRG